MNIDLDDFERQMLDQHAREVRALADLRGCIVRMQGNGFLAAGPPPFPLELPAARPAKAGKRESGKAGVGRAALPRRASSSRGGMRDAIRAVIGHWAADRVFTSADVGAGVPDIAATSVRSQLTRWIKAKVLRERAVVSGRIQYQRGPKWEDAGGKDPSPRPSPLGGEREKSAPPNPNAEGVPSEPSYSMRGRPSERRRLVEQIAEEWGPAKQWLVTTMIEELQKRAPHLVDDEKKHIAVRSELMDAYSQGKLKSVGSGPARYYSTTRIRSIGGRLAVDNADEGDGVDMATND